MRMFAAVRLSEEAVEDLEDFLEPRRDAFDVRWTPPEHWHVTLAFLPEVPGRKLDDLIDRTAAALSGRRSLHLSVRGGGVFPDPFSAKVFWAGLDSSATDREELDRWASGCRNAANVAGVEVDGGRFRPHLTLARRPRGGDATRWLRLLDTYQGPAWPVDAVELVTSILGQGRNGSPRHVTEATLPVK